MMLDGSPDNLNAVTKGYISLTHTYSIGPAKQILWIQWFTAAQQHSTHVTKMQLNDGPDRVGYTLESGELVSGSQNMMDKS